MNGLHDMGGMDGFGPIPIEEDEPVFHAEWEKRVFALFFGEAMQGYFNLYEFRHHTNSIDPVRFLNTSYYEQWFDTMETLLLKKGVVTQDELDARIELLKKEHA